MRRTKTTLSGLIALLLLGLASLTAAAQDTDRTGTGGADGLTAASLEPSVPMAVSEEQIVLETAEASTATFSCNDSGVCKYKGTVRLTYVNDNHLILMYPSQDVSASTVQTEVEASGYEAYWGVDVTAFSAFAVPIPRSGADPAVFQSQSEFADKFFKLALAAQLTGRDLNIQMRGAWGGYLRIDRAWLH